MEKASVGLLEQEETVRQDTPLYEDIAKRTGGDIYIGVVGPVRTGKSTFITRFMEELVIPSIENIYQKERARDELPQSGSGRTIMTAEPKFVPENAVEIKLGPAKLQVRMIDCVGYMVPGALGSTENDQPRMVSTPWFDHPVPMAEAAEIGTQKVIRDHSTIGLVVTTDGSVTDIDRADYVAAEERVIRELKAIGKPFMILVNSKSPKGAAATSLVSSLRATHGVTCMAADCMNLDSASINDIIRSVLYEFPISEIKVFLPSWAKSIESGHWLGEALTSAISEAAAPLRKISDIEPAAKKVLECEYVSGGGVESISLGDGAASLRFDLPRSLFYKILSEQSGFEIRDDGDLPALLGGLSEAKKKYDRIAKALDSVNERGYGIVMPDIDELHLEEPEIVHQGGRFGVKLRASAPSIHMMRANIETEVSPVVGSEKQSEDLVQYLLREFEEDTTKIWNSNIFGKSLHELVSEGLTSKLTHMPDDAQGKLRETLERIINEGSGGLICIIL